MVTEVAVTEIQKEQKRYLTINQPISFNRLKQWETALFICLSSSRWWSRNTPTFFTGLRILYTLYYQWFGTSYLRILHKKDMVKVFLPFESLEFFDPITTIIYFFLNIFEMSTKFPSIWGKSKSKARFNQKLS